MFIAVVVAALLAQAPAKKPIETAHLSMTTSASAAAGGGKVTLWLDVTPRPKMHVYAPGQDGYIAITLTLDADAGVTAAKAKYPAGEKYVMPALNETMLVYARPFRIAQDVTIKPAAGGTKTIKGTVRYQACDDQICFLPKTVPVEWTVNVK
jgi:DsbC/DsbD-like thiol-disulfide interchange protein